jgi:hypothetical protein
MIQVHITAELLADEYGPHDIYTGRFILSPPQAGQSRDRDGMLDQGRDEKRHLDHASAHRVLGAEVSFVGVLLTLSGSLGRC